MKRLTASIFCLLVVAGCQRETPDQFDIDGIRDPAAEADSTADGRTTINDSNNTFAIVGTNGKEIIIPKGSQDPIEIDLRDILPNYMATDFLSQFPDMKVRLVQESELGVTLGEYEIEITGISYAGSDLHDQKVRLAEFVKTYMDGTAAEKRPQIDTDFSEEERAAFRTMSTSRKYEMFLVKMKETFPGFNHEWVRMGGNTGVFYKGKELLIDGVEEIEVRESIAQFILTLVRELDLAGVGNVDFSYRNDRSGDESPDPPARTVTLADYIATDISNREIGNQPGIDASFSEEERAIFQNMSASEKLHNFVLRLETKYDGFRYDWVGKGGNGGNGGVVHRGKNIQMYGVDDEEERKAIAQFILMLQRDMDLTGVRNDKFENAGIVASTTDNSTRGPNSSLVDYRGIDQGEETAGLESGLDSDFSDEERVVFQSMSANDKLSTFVNRVTKKYPEFSYDWVKKDGNSDVQYRGKEILVGGIEDSELRHSIGLFIRSLQTEIDLTGVREF